MTGGPGLQGVARRNLSEEPIITPTRALWSLLRSAWFMVWQKARTGDMTDSR